MHSLLSEFELNTVQILLAENNQRQWMQSQTEKPTKGLQLQWHLALIVHMYEGTA